MKKFNLFLTTIIFFGILAGCMTNLDSVHPQIGMVYGEVTIGPLCPVEPCQISEEQIEDAYAARKIIIYEEDSTTIAQTLSIGDDHYYKAYLLPGKYVVDIDHSGMDHSSDVPKAIKIEANEMMRLDIDIDTGIR